MMAARLQQMKTALLVLLASAVLVPGAATSAPDVSSTEAEAEADAVDGALDAESNAPEEAIIPPEFFGDYLSARFATTSRDTDAAADYYVRTVASDPFNKGLVQQAFSLSVASGRIDDAIRMARRLVDLQEKPTGLMDLVLLVGDISDNKLVDARTRIDSMSQSGIVALMGPLISAWVRTAEGDTDGAIVDLERLTASRGFLPFQATHKAYIFDYAGRIDDARTAYTDAIALQKGADLRLVLAYGRFLERLDEVDRAAAVYDAYIEKYPSNVLIEDAKVRVASGKKPSPLIGSVAEGAAEAFFSTGRALAQERSRPSAIVYLQLARALRPDFPVANLLLGTVLEQDGRTESALEAFQVVTDDAVLGRDARFEAAVLLAKLERTDEAITALQAMVKDRPGDMKVLSTLADTLRGAENYKDAREFSDKAISLIDLPAPRHWALFYSRGISLERLDEWDGAEADFKKALELEPDQPLVLNYLGYTWIERGEKLDEALAMIERAVEQRPNDGYVVDSLGWALFRLGQFEESVAWLEKASQLKPEDPTINEHLGDAYWQTGRRLEATFQWRHALAMKPEKDAAQKIREKIASGLGVEKHSGN